MKTIQITEIRNHERAAIDIEPGREWVVKLLHQMSRERAGSAKWDNYSLVLICGVLVAVVLLNARSVNMIVTGIIALIGLAILWFVGWLRARKLEKEIYEEELPRYKETLSDNLGIGSAAVGAGTVEEVPLTKRELQVLGRIAKGEMNKEIAVALGVSQNTIRNQISQILRKLNVNDRTGAVVLALSRGWLKSSPVDQKELYEEPRRELRKKSPKESRREPYKGLRIVPHNKPHVRPRKEPYDVTVQCPTCKTVETLQFVEETLTTCRKFFQKDGKVYHDCGSEIPCRLNK